MKPILHYFCPIPGKAEPCLKSGHNGHSCKIKDKEKVFLKLQGRATSSRTAPQSRQRGRINNLIEKARPLGYLLAAAVCLFSAAPSIAADKGGGDPQKEEIIGITEGVKKEVVVFYLDEQFRPISKLERLGPLSQGIRAILAMYALQVGGGCEGHDEMGLKCELTKSLGLGAQCSDEHLSLVRSWFKKEIPPMSGHPEHTIQRVLKSGDLQSICYNAPYTATNQVIWEIIRVKKDNDHIFVDAINRWTVSADGPSGQNRYKTEYRINADTVTVIAHEKLSWEI